MFEWSLIYFISRVNNTNQRVLQIYFVIGLNEDESPVFLSPFELYADAFALLKLLEALLDSEDEYPEGVFFYHQELVFEY